ncbi:MAG: acylase, partial [Gemmatimonadetes bacterium]|nr:acylase [Gemmatimonadota bacterium]
GGGGGGGGGGGTDSGRAGRGGEGGPPGANPATNPNNGEDRATDWGLGSGRLTMSNVIALGRDGTDNGRGMVFINPHWRWHEPERFYEVHLTVPGQLDVYGGTFSGIPAVLLGFNDRVAWSHTASVPKRETIYQLRLVPGAPTSYEYDGNRREMTPRIVAVEVKEDDGRLTRREHTVWETHFGPMIATGALPWTDSTGYAVKLATLHLRWLNQQVAMNQARSAGEMDEAGRRYMALGWLNTVAADDQGRMIYADRSSVPNVTDAMRQECGSEFAKRAWTQQQLVVLDGWRAGCEWATDPDAPVPGIFGPKKLPMLDRWDYATNSNDSHWANNPRQLLEGFDAIIGDERTQRSLRTRIGLAKIEGRLAGTDGLPGNRFSLAQLEAITMNNRVYSGELWRDEVVRYCRSLPRQKGIPEGCEVLARWDLSDNLDSPGAVLWRRFMEQLGGAAQPDLELFTTPLDPRDPLGTPRGLNTANPRVYRALAAAIGDLRDNGMPLSARLRESQIEERSGKRIPIPGGPVPTGQYNLIMTGSGWVPGKGWHTVLHASSYVAWVQYTDRGPVARSVLASGQSDDSASPHHADQTLLFSAGKSKAVVFDQAAIRQTSRGRVVTVCLPCR